MKKEDISILQEIFAEEVNKYKKKVADLNKRLNTCKADLRSKKKELRDLLKMYDQAKEIETRKNLLRKISELREKIVNAQLDKKELTESLTESKEELNYFKKQYESLK